MCRVVLHPPSERVLTGRSKKKLGRPVLADSASSEPVSVDHGTDEFLAIEAFANSFHKRHGRYPNLNETRDFWRLRNAQPSKR
jgi:hypothetical protein